MVVFLLRDPRPPHHLPRLLHIVPALERTSRRLGQHINADSHANTRWRSCSQRVSSILLIRPISRTE